MDAVLWETTMLLHRGGQTVEIDSALATSVDRCGRTMLHHLARIWDKIDHDIATDCMRRLLSAGCNHRQADCVGRCASVIGETLGNGFHAALVGAGANVADLPIDKIGRRAGDVPESSAAEAGGEAAEEMEGASDGRVATWCVERAGLACRLIQERVKESGVVFTEVFSALAGDGDDLTPESLDSAAPAINVAIGRQEAAVVVVAIAAGAGAQVRLRELEAEAADADGEGEGQAWLDALGEGAPAAGMQDFQAFCAAGGP